MNHTCNHNNCDSTDFNPKTASWPSAGRIDFVDVSARYREGLDLVVKDISVSFPPSAKIGICGVCFSQYGFGFLTLSIMLSFLSMNISSLHNQRTGAGKSSMLSLLFRLVECAEGRILIDGRDIATVDLEILRRSLSIIPQDPVMFDGIFSDFKCPILS
jgi:ABC-type multidrug transport system fused ATPase/permease subunit